MSAERERAMLGIAADLLGQNSILHIVSVALTGVAAFALAVGGSPAPRAWGTLMVLAIVLGAVQTVLAVRTGLDAALFRRLAGGLDLSTFDAGMAALGLLAPHKTGRPVLARVSGARRLMLWQAAALLAQGLCFGAAAILQAGPRI